MEYINAIIGETEMFVPTNDRLGELLFTANRRVNYHKYIAKMRKAYQGKIESRAIVMDSDFFYALEDVMEEKGYDSVVHHQFEKSTVEQSKVLYALFREDSLRLRAKYREFDILLVAELEVLGNSPIEITNEINYLAENGIKVLSLKDGELNGEALPVAFRKNFRLVK